MPEVAANVGSGWDNVLGKLADMLAVRTATPDPAIADLSLPAAVEMLDTTEFAHSVFGALIPLSEIVPHGLVPLAAGSAHGKLVVDVSA